MNLPRLRRIIVPAAGFAATLALLAFVPAWASSPAAADASGEPPSIQDMHAACASGDADDMDGAMGSLTPEDLEWMNGHMGDGQHDSMGQVPPHGSGAMDGHMGGAYHGPEAHGMMGATQGGASGWMPEPALWW